MVTTTSLQHPNLVDATHPSSHMQTTSSQPNSHSYGTSAGHRELPLDVGSASVDYAATPAQNDSSLLSQAAAEQSGRFNEEWNASRRGSSILQTGGMDRSNSVMSQQDTLLPSRGGTLKKKASLRRGESVKRSSSRKSSRTGMTSLRGQPDEQGLQDETNSAFFSPVPTTGNPTEILANRFAAWRKVLKDLITYFREIQAQYEHKSKTLLKISNVINNTQTPLLFQQTSGLDEALTILRRYHRDSIAASNKSRDIEEDVILALTGLRSDLQQKIKEIRNLSGDFKNNVEKEMEGTRRAVNSLNESLGPSDIDYAHATAKQDPYLLKVAVDRQLERQIDEENYLHQAYLNLETSGRELEAIVVGEIQKSYNAYAGILKREGDESANTVVALRSGPIAMDKDAEWDAFVEKDQHFVDPRISVRKLQNIHYPGRDNPLASEVRAGLLERKSKYLKSYTPGWYVLTPTHLHEFKSADKMQAPIMSLFLHEQKLGSHSTEGGSSNKFMLKGRQTGSLHRGHSWVFRAESHDTMLAWYEDIKALTENSPQERTAFVRQHARSISGTSQKAPSFSSDGMVDEEDEEPFSAAASAVVAPSVRQDSVDRPKPGGRFPSDLQVNAQRGLQAPLSPSSGSSGYGDREDHDIVAAAADLPGSGVGEHYPENSYGNSELEPTHASNLNAYAAEDGVNPYTSQPISEAATHRDSMFGSGAAGDAGYAATESYRDRQAAEAPEVDFAPDERSRANAAAYETVAGPATAETEADPPMFGPVNDASASNLGGNASLAAMEASQIAAPDNDILNGDSNDNGNMYKQEDSAPPIIHSGPYIRDTGYISRFSTPSTMDTSMAPSSAATPSVSTPSGATTYGPSPFISADRSTPTETARSAKVALEPITTPTRPSLAETVRAGQHHESVVSVSQLHIPGEFPRSSGRETTSSVAL